MENSIEKQQDGYLPTYKGCMVCGDKETNPCTLNLRFVKKRDCVETTYKPDKRQEGYENVLHGGITSALLDETIGWACACEAGRYFVTVELNIRFLKPIPIDTEVTVRGRATSHYSKFYEGEGEIIGEDGEACARAKAKYFILPEIESRRVHDYLTFKDNDIDILKGTTDNRG